MDNKTIFVRTSTGEEQVQSRTSHLSGDVKRALSMVDGVSTFGEISKRSAPSMRANLAEMFEELEKTGLIQDKSFAGKIPKSAVPPQMVVPVKIATPRKPTAAENDSDELDFVSGFNRYSPADGKSKRDIEAEKAKVQQEAEAVLRQAEHEARQRLEAAAKEQREAEAARLKAEQEARRVREELEAARLKAEQEARLRLEAAERERKEAEAARIKAEQEAKRVSEELEAARLKAEQEARLRFEAAERERKEAEAARLKAEQEAAQRQIELELAKRRDELEAQAQAAARKKTEEEAEQARIATQAREAADKQAAQTGEPTAGKTGSFAFDAFQIDEFQQTSGPQKKHEPAQKAEPGEAAPAAAKQDAFAFDYFNVDEPARPVEPRQDRHPGEAAKPARPADVIKPVERAVPPPAASAVEHKPGKEEVNKDQLKQETQARIAEEARAKEMADAQAKVWAEAEQRALEAARTHAERVAQYAEHPPKTGRAAKPVHVARAPRKPFAWGRLGGIVLMLGIFLLVLLVGALFVVPYFLPMRDYMPKIQKLLSDELHQPVHLGYLSGRILPTPRLDLGEIYIGDAKQFQAATAQINFEIMGVFDDKKPISSVDFQDVKVRGMALRDSAAWLQQLAGDKQYPVSRMTITHGALDADTFQLTGVEGELNFNPAGKFTHAELSANSGKYTLGIDPAPGGKLLAAITVRGSALPLLPNWTFNELDAKGEISSDGLLISNFDARILDGTLKGNARINWLSGWRADGVLSAKKIVMKNFSKLLNGNVDGSAHFRMNSTDLAGLTDSAELEGNFVSTDGLIGGLDIVETARMRSRENLPGGRTHYDRLSGDFTYANDVYHFTQVKIDAGVLNAVATFDINKQQLSGKMKVHLAMHNLVTADLQLGGAFDDPTLVYVP
jgi:hypothetical protein